MGFFLFLGSLLLVLGPISAYWLEEFSWVRERQAQWTATAADTPMTLELEEVRYEFWIDTDAEEPGVDLYPAREDRNMFGLAVKRHHPPPALVLRIARKTGRPRAAAAPQFDPLSWHSGAQRPGPRQNRAGKRK